MAWQVGHQFRALLGRELLPAESTALTLGAKPCTKEIPRKQGTALGCFRGLCLHCVCTHSLRALCPGQTETGRLGHPLLQGVETEQQKAVHPNSAQGNKEVLLGQIQAKGGGHLEFFVGVHFSSSVMSCTEKEPVLMCLIVLLLVSWCSVICAETP